MYQISVAFSGLQMHVRVVITPVLCKANMHGCAAEPV
jgi:hypothetical protein